MASSNQPQEIHLPRDGPVSDHSTVKDGDVPTRKMGRPPIALTEDVLERRRLRVNASRPRVEDGDVPARKRGRPLIPLTEEVLEQRRVSKQRANASRTESEGPARKRGRPKHVRAESVLELRGSSRAEVRGLQPQETESNGMVNVNHASVSNPSKSTCQDGMQWKDLNDGGTGMKEILIIMFVEWRVVVYVAYYMNQVVRPESGVERNSLYFLHKLQNTANTMDLQFPTEVTLGDKIQFKEIKERFHQYKRHPALQQQPSSYWQFPRLLSSTFKTMKTSATPLAALSSNSDHDTIQVCVTRIWEAINKRNGSTLHTNVILLDEKDNHILAIIRNNQKHSYLPILKEGEVYAISNFKVVPAPKLYKPVDGDSSINFFYKTRIEKGVDSPAIPQHKFELNDFASIQTLVGNVALLIDVIGMVKSHGKPERRANGAKKLDVMLGNERDENMLITLWEEKAKQFQALMSSSNGGPVFMVFTGLLAKKFSDAASLSSTDATRCYANIEYAPLNALKEELTKTSNENQAGLPAPIIKQFLTSTGDTVQELPISSILETVIPPGTMVVRCICQAKIVNVLGGNGWYYNCCPTCARALRDQNGKFYCLSCDEKTPSLAQRFRIVVRVEDQSGSTTVTLFNKEAEQLVGIPLHTVLAEKAEEEEIPPVVRNIIGKVCAFQLKITLYNIIQGCEEYTVTRVSEVPSEAPGIEIIPASANMEPPASPCVNKKQKLT